MNNRVDNKGGVGIGNRENLLPSPLGKRVPARTHSSRARQREQDWERVRDRANERQRGQERERERDRSSKERLSETSLYIYIYKRGVIGDISGWGRGRGRAGDTVPVPAPTSDGYLGNLPGLTPVPGQTGDSPTRMGPSPASFFANPNE